MADRSFPYGNYGGYHTTSVTAGDAETNVLSGAGRLNKLSIVTAGTAAFSIYDGTQSTGGILIYTSITNDPVGTVKTLDFPVANGITVKGTTGSAGMAVVYTGNGNQGQ